MKISGIGIFALLIAPVSAAYAEVGSPKSASVTYNEVSIEYKGTRTGDDRRALNNEQEHEFEAYYGVTDTIKLGFERVYEREAGDGFESEAFVPNITYELTQQGDWWLSSALYGQYKFEDGDNDAVKAIAIAERRDGALLSRANLGIEREVGAGRSHGVSVETALQGVYLWREGLNPGVEWFADYGKANDFSDTEDQEHYVGPVIMGTLFDIGPGEMKYAAGYYWGVTDASADNAQRVKLEYEFQF